MKLSDTTKIDGKIGLILRRLRDNWHTVSPTGKSPAGKFLYSARYWYVNFGAEYEYEGITYTVLILKRYESPRVEHQYYNVTIQRNMRIVLRSGIYPAPESAIMTDDLEENVRRIISYYERHRINLTVLSRIDEYELRENLRLPKLRITKPVYRYTGDED